MYRPQTLIYDLTRKYYLFGRDLLIAGLAATPGQVLLDLGCGTGRNLVAAAKAWPGLSCIGLDASAAMIETAARKVTAAGLDGRVQLLRGDAETFDLRTITGRHGVDHVTISYALSMMDAPERAIRQGLALLRAGGTLHVVDFGDMEGLPAVARAAMRRWLHGFGVHHRPEVLRLLRELERDGSGRLTHRRLLAGYAQLSRFTTAR